MNEKMKPSDYVLWYLQRPITNQLRENISVDVAIVGGGIAGLSAAQEFAKRGKKVALFEQYFCGSGATGKSSGFVTPNAELSCSDFAKKFGMSGAREIWNMINGGVDLIRDNIVSRGLSCGYQDQDTLVLASTQGALKGLLQEHEIVDQLGYKTSMFDQHSVQQFVGSKEYFGGIMYPDTFGMDGYAYCQQMKSILEQQGVLMYEETPVMSVDGHVLQLPHAQVTADFIVMCVDRFLPDLGMQPDDVFQAQTFVMASQVLTSEQIRKIFPSRNLMCWDTQMIYNYFRISSDNRLILGGGDLFSTFAQTETHGYMRIVTKLQDYFKAQFPELDLQFEYRWSGLIGISKDIVPLIGADQKDPYRYYVTASAGLPIAAALGAYSVQSLLDGRRDMEQYFSIHRSFAIGGVAQRVLGKKLSFALSGLWNQNIV